MNIQPAIDLTDPPGMPEDERMTDAEFRMVREALGLTGDWLAAHLGVSGRTIRHWEQGKFAIPDGVRLELERLDEATGAMVGSIVEQLHDMRDPAVSVFRTDSDFHAAYPDLPIPFPASWFRATVYRACLEVLGVAVSYFATTDEDAAPGADRT